MTVAELSFPKAFRVRFRDLRRFDPASFHGISWHWSSDVMFPIGSALKLRKEKVDRAEYEFSQLQPITIHFDGTIDKRKVEGRGYSMDLFFARSGDIVVAKIDLKNGAVGIVPDWENVVVTNHFAVYEPDRSKIIPEYFLLVIQANFFKSYLWRNKVGAEGRKEVKLEFFESIKIPMPSLDEQRRIVAAWQQAQEKAVKAQERVVEFENQISFLVSEKLGRKKNDSARPKYFALQWRDVDRWGVEIVWHTRNQKSGSHFPIRTIGELCKIGSGGTPSRERPNYFGGDILWVKTTEVRNKVIFDTEEKITKLGLNNSSAKIYPAGSLLVAMYGQGATRGRTAKLGVPASTNQACAVLSEFSQDIEPDYLWYYLMSEYDNLRLQASGNNQPNLNAAMIASYPVPVPPLKVQKEIIRHVEEVRCKIRQEQEAAAKVAEESEREVERMILGLLKA